MHWFLKFIFGVKLYMFRTVPLSIIRRFSLYTQQWYMSYRFADSLQAVSKTVWHIPLLCVQWKSPDDGQRNCPKHVEFYSKNKFEKSVHLVGFITRIYHDARSPARQTTMSIGFWPFHHVSHNPFCIPSWKTLQLVLTGTPTAIWHGLVTVHSCISTHRKKWCH